MCVDFPQVSLVIASSIAMKMLRKSHSSYSGKYIWAVCHFVHISYTCLNFMSPSPFLACSGFFAQDLGQDLVFNSSEGSTGSLRFNALH